MSYKFNSHRSNKDIDSIYYQFIFNDVITDIL